MASGEFHSRGSEIRGYYKKPKQISKDAARISFQAKNYADWRKEDNLEIFID